MLRRGIKKLFPFMQTIGIHVTPNHFYGPVPDTRELRPEIFSEISKMVGINMQEDAQLALLSSFGSTFRESFSALSERQPTAAQQFSFGNGMFESVDAEFLYGFIRSALPRRIVEVGSGYSTLLIAEGVRALSHEVDFTVIDPYIDARLRSVPELTTVLQLPVQEVGLDLFMKLDEGDILFIDSSHVLKIGSDVQFEYLEILPRLRHGVLIHLHDVFLPREYPREWVCDKQLFWNEQYLLQALLTGNSSFVVRWAGHYMHLRHPEVLDHFIPSYNRARSSPGSFWVERVMKAASGSS